MKICLIAEGSYPYTVGGVSSWVQMLINAMPEHTFVIHTICAYEKDKGNFRYELPSNVTELREVSLDVILKEEGKWGKRYKIDLDLKKAMVALLSGDKLDWNVLFEFFNGNEEVSVTDFLMSKDFFDILQMVYKEKYSQTAFTDLFWTIRSMILPLLYIMKQDIPEADLYHSVSTGYAGILGSLGKYLYNKPFILTEHGIYTREREEEIIKADWVKIYFKDTWIEYFYNLSDCAYSIADKVITLFNRNKEIEIELGCDEEKVSIVPNGVDIDSYRNIPCRDEKDGFINIGAVLRVVPIKDIKTMIQSFALTKEEVPNIRLYIMGPCDEDEGYYEECRQLAESLRAEDIIFTGNINVKEYIGKMDILILSSISEGQPFAVLEGMACGKPFVATDVGSCRELLYGAGDEFGNAGIIVPVMNYEKLSQALITLCRDEDLRIRMGQNAFNRVSERYTYELFINSYKSIYKEFEVK